MPILGCTVVTCSYNKENKCCLDNIKVEGASAQINEATACGSFRDKTKETYSNSLEGCGCGGPKSNVTIDCAATKCVHNESCKCAADKIDVAGSNACTCGETKCDTFCCQ